MRATGLSTVELYPPDGEWERHLHDALARPWPCAARADAEGVWSDVVKVFAAMGLQGRYAGWADGNLSFGRAAWCLTRHLRPLTVVETGVARGVTTRFILEALERNGAGHLWSIDLPSVDPRFHDQIGAAVPRDRRDRWTYLLGTSRHLLPGLLAELREIDFFVHDSLHTGRNTQFELERAWRVLRPGGALLVDDIYQSLAFRQFVEAVRPAGWLVGQQPDGSYSFGIVLMALAGAGRGNGVAGALN